MSGSGESTGGVLDDADTVEAARNLFPDGRNPMGLSVNSVEKSIDRSKIHPEMFTDEYYRTVPAPRDNPSSAATCRGLPIKQKSVALTVRLNFSIENEENFIANGIAS